MFKIKKYSRFNYWSCSKIADWVRGTPKPTALEWEAWDSWHDEAKKKHPIRYWIAEEMFDFLQDVVNLPFDIYHTIEVYIRNRYVDKIHYLRTGLKPGEYYDLDWRILNGLFNELAIYVESELAYTMTAYKDRRYKFVKGRCKQAGLDHLDWAMNLKMNEDYGVLPDDKDYGKPTAQAIAAKKIYELYNWWLDREYRVNPHDLFTKEKDGKYYFRQIQKMEEAYDKEDTKMLIKLIKIRSDLWT